MFLQTNDRIINLKNVSNINILGHQNRIVFNLNYNIEIMTNYKEGSKLVEEINEITKRKRKLGFSDLQYNVLVILEGIIGQNGRLENYVKDLFKKLNSITFKGWTSQPTAIKNVEKDLRTSLRKDIYKKYKINSQDFNKLYEKIIILLKERGETIVKD